LPAFLSLAFPKTTKVFALVTPLCPRIEHNHKEIPLKPQGTIGKKQYFGFGSLEILGMVGIKDGKSRQKHDESPALSGEYGLAAVFVLQ